MLVFSLSFSPFSMVWAGSGTRSLVGNRAVNAGNHTGASAGPGRRFVHGTAVSDSRVDPLIRNPSPPPSRKQRASGVNGARKRVSTRQAPPRRRSKRGDSSSAQNTGGKTNQSQQQEKSHLFLSPGGALQRPSSSRVSTASAQGSSPAVATPAPSPSSTGFQERQTTVPVATPTYSSIPDATPSNRFIGDPSLPMVFDKVRRRWVSKAQKTE